MGLRIVDFLKKVDLEEICDLDLVALFFDSNNACVFFVCEILLG